MGGKGGERSCGEELEGGDEEEGGVEVKGEVVGNGGGRLLGGVGGEWVGGGGDGVWGGFEKEWGGGGVGEGVGFGGVGDGVEGRGVVDDGGVRDGEGGVMELKNRVMMMCLWVVVGMMRIVGECLDGLG